MGHLPPAPTVVETRTNNQVSMSVRLYLTGSKRKQKEAKGSKRKQKEAKTKNNEEQRQTTRNNEKQRKTTKNNEEIDRLLISCLCVGFGRRRRQGWSTLF
jgi:DNA modification methylase